MSYQKLVDAPSVQDEEGANSSSSAGPLPSNNSSSIQHVNEDHALLQRLGGASSRVLYYFRTLPLPCVMQMHLMYLVRKSKLYV